MNTATASCSNLHSDDQEREMNRREFVKVTAGAAALFATQGRAYSYAVSPGVPKFIDPLPMFGTNIPILTANKTRYPGVDYYEIVAGAFRQQLHSLLPPGGTRLYGYAADPGPLGTPVHAALGGVIVATK